MIREDLVDAARRFWTERDVVVFGSIGVARTSIWNDLVDEFRLLILPTVLGAGRRLFDADSGRRALRLVSSEPVGSAVLVRYQRA